MDVLIGAFWSLAYIFIIVCSFQFRREKCIYMPLIAGALNLGWEFLAFLRSGGYWVHSIWLLLDVFILAYNVYILGSIKRRLLYLLVVLAGATVLYGVFTLSNGMLIAAFILDIEMAVEYLIVLWKTRPKKDTNIYIWIGIFRLLGDLSAWLGYMRSSTVVLVTGAAVLVVNALYLCFCFELLARNRQNSKKRRSTGKRPR